ncbi:hypothetical protein E4191_15295 [Paracoccus liaowanqingii]|uniref:Uncharacterized protein n=1 Tax=Paracoccus liaowanqingii TaxID=2560053 RepID=A0A4P7HQ21_9RHOB|nr:hypothetical protein [Paracoccus liaowanqingii]QBX35900.1 hypothetical protein E4191_15295 [Paracoccus liaowanqingii]
MIATQRSKPDFEVNNGPMSVAVHPNGDLVLSGLTGGERGLRIKASVSLDEVLAWLPEMIAKARNHTGGKAKQELTEALRQEGYIVTTSPRVKISPLRGA